MSSKPRDLLIVAEEQRICNLSDQEAAERIGRVMQENGALRGEDYPALVRVWDNESDKVFDLPGWEQTIVTDDDEP